MRVITTTCLFILACFAPSQGQEKQITYTADSEIVWAGVDRASDLLIELKTGEVQKINLQGKRVGQFRFKSIPTLLDPLDGAQAFYYDRATNAYGTLSADLSFATPHILDSAFAITPWLVCPVLHELWILDVSDFSLKKTSQHATTIGVESALKHLPGQRMEDYLSLREYQNYLFLLDKSAGIQVFNSLGKFLKTLGEKDILYVGFLGEEVYYKKGNELILLDLYSDEKRTLALPASGQFAYLVDDRIYLVSGNTVTILPFQP